MGWTCQHDFGGHCKLLNVTCKPGIKGCILNKGKKSTFFQAVIMKRIKKEKSPKKRTPLTLQHWRGQIKVVKLPFSRHSGASAVKRALLFYGTKTVSFRQQEMMQLRKGV